MPEPQEKRRGATLPSLGAGAVLSSNPRQAFRGERLLLAAIVEDAVECFCKTCGSRERRNQALYRETENWLFSDDRSQFLSFANVCDVLGVDPAKLRETLSKRGSGRSARHRHTNRAAR